MTSVSQISHQFNSEGRNFTVKAETQSTHKWVNGEPVFSDTDVVVLESTNADGYDHKLQVVMPLAAAIEFAKAVLAAQQQADEDATTATKLKLPEPPDWAHSEIVQRRQLTPEPDGDILWA